MINFKIVTINGMKTEKLNETEVDINGYKTELYLYSNLLLLVQESDYSDLWVRVKKYYYGWPMFLYFRSGTVITGQ